MEPDKELIVIGGGAAGLSAAQYGARANLSLLLLEELAAGGQCLIIDNLENYPGFPEPITGFELGRRLEDQARKFGAEIRTLSARSVRRQGDVFQVDTDDGPLTSRAVILATGASHRALGIPGEKELAGRGVSYCATCDGPFFRDKRILVVGGGDTACDEASFLAKLTDKVLMIHRRDRFRAQKALAERVLHNPHLQVRFNTEARQIQGRAKVEGVLLYDKLENRTYTEEVQAVFIFVGLVPRSGLVEGLELDEAGYIKTNQAMETNIRGLFAAGDVRSTPFRQLVVAAGEGAIAAHSAVQYIDELRNEAYR